MDKPEFTRGKGCNNRKLSDEDRAEVVRLYTTPLPDGTWMGASTIARCFEVRHATIYRVLDLAGVERRSAAESHRGKACKPITNLPVGDAPDCKCGCGDSTAWNQRKNRWNAYVAGHRFKPAPYKDPAWLTSEYVEKNRTLREIAADCGVSESAVARHMRLNGIPRRDRSAARVGRQVGSKNPAWKGGIAKWDYASNWKWIARGIRRRDNWTCQLCDEQHPKTSKLLHVHHIDGNKLNNDPLNLISVCAACHPRGRREIEMAPLLRELTSRKEGGDA